MTGAMYDTGIWTFAGETSPSSMFTRFILSRRTVISANAFLRVNPPRRQQVVGWHVLELDTSLRHESTGRLRWG